MRVPKHFCLEVLHCQFLVFLIVSAVMNMRTSFEHALCFLVFLRYLGRTKETNAVPLPEGTEGVFHSYRIVVGLSRPGNVKATAS